MGKRKRRLVRRRVDKVLPQSEAQGEVILSYKDSMAALSTSFQAGDQILIGAADSFAVAKNESFEIYSYGSVDIPTNQVSSDKSIVSLRFKSDPDIVRCQFGQVEKSDQT